MRFRPLNVTRAGRRRGFSLVEVLAAMLLVAIVVPVAVEAVSLSAQVGSVAQRKREAAQLADRLLSEAVVTGSWQTGATDTSELEAAWPELRFEVTSEAWPDSEALMLVTATVVYEVRGLEYEARVSTLAPATESTEEQP